MAKYNLLDDDDIFDEKEEISTDDELIQERKRSDSNIDMTAITIKSRSWPGFLILTRPKNSRNKLLNVLYNAHGKNRCS